ncbi:MAG: ATPase, central region [Ramlibacter sp.]|nr:ATPase, central region [Ramlibacter sp.]
MLRAWLEEKLMQMLLFAATAGALVWLGSLVLKGISGQPVLYAYRPEFSGETSGLFIMAVVLLIGLAYGLVAKWATSRFEHLDVVTFAAPWMFIGTVLVLAVWVLSGPSKEASFLPLVIVVLLSGWATYATRWGFLSFRVMARQPQEGSGLAANGEPARVSRPKITFRDLHGNDATKRRLSEAARAITTPRKDHARARNGILLHGGPGNGKTAFAEALAGELDLPLVTLTHSDVASPWVGEKTARVRQAFEQAKCQQPCVLFIDEVDSFLEARIQQPGGIKEDRDLVNAMLTLLVDIREFRVVLVAATNHVDRLDSAGIREGRFDFKVEITPPDQTARIGLLRKGLRDNLPDVQVDDTIVAAVARRWNGFSAKRILAVTEELPSYMRAHGLTTIGFEDLLGALRQLQGQRGHVPESVLSLSDLVLSESTRELLEQIVARMADPEHTERHGGTLPSGVLFSGPPGTGKTAACKALARQVGWAFLPATGAELAREPAALDTLYAKALDLRPAIIFIDEADELVRSREFSLSTQATNKLLTLMDGVGDRVRDVVWIAATNHPEQVDPALLRGGRFTEKVPFLLPSADALAAWVGRWLAERKVQLADDVAPAAFARVLQAQSIANAEAVLQAALNGAIARRQRTVAVGLADLQQAARTVLGAP